MTVLEQDRRGGSHKGTITIGYSRTGQGHTVYIEATRTGGYSGNKDKVTDIEVTRTG